MTSMPSADPNPLQPIVTGSDLGATLRAKLRIPASATVFGWYGGHDAWDPDAAAPMVKVARARPHDAFFLLQNFPPEQISRVAGVSNILLLNTSASVYRKVAFLQVL